MALELPGVTVSIVDGTDIIAPPVWERYPVIIGEGDPYRKVVNQRVIRSAGSVDNLRTVTSVNEIISVGDLPGISNYQATSDYVLSGDTISWAPAGDQPTLGDAFYVTFTETRPASAYAPRLYFNGNKILADHGEKTRTSGTINDVSVGGSLALNAGAKGVIIAQLNLSGATDPDNPTPAELEAAFTSMRDELNKITDYKLFLVPMSSGTLNTTSAANILWNHAVLASQPKNKQERTVVAALEKNKTYLEAATFAQTYANERMIVPYAYNAISRPVGFTTEYDMRFYNAALAGKLCSVPIGKTITDEVIPNVLLNDNLTPEEYEYLVQRGVSPAKMSGEVVRNILSITTDTTDARTEDLGVQDTKDYVKKYLREGLWSTYKNAPINDNLLGQVTASCENILEYLISEVVISDYRNVSVDQNTTEPRKLDITASVLPAYCTTWVDVVFTFELSF